MGARRASGRERLPTRFDIHEVIRCGARRVWLASRGHETWSAPSDLDRHQYDNLPPVRSHRNRTDADRRLPILLRLQGLRDGAEAQTWRLLRLLLLRHGSLSAGSAGHVPSLNDHGPADAGRLAQELARSHRAAEAAAFDLVVHETRIGQWRSGIIARPTR